MSFNLNLLKLISLKDSLIYKAVVFFLGISIELGGFLLIIFFIDDFSIYNFVNNFSILNFVNNLLVFFLSFPTGLESFSLINLAGFLLIPSIELGGFSPS